ncbi:MAG: BamA/TamA family outer membrane protein [Bacteroidales bacterium]|nr:BamA/TamA family outer membrane protein [Bacteroidales bacterium]MDZ4204581.1 BamA/TamA family outer membrane protein [Bacteroidales bacterium]
MLITVMAWSCFLFTDLLIAQSSYKSLPEKIIIGNIITEGNKETHATIVKRELLITKGDTLLPETLMQLLHRSRENLLNTSLFNFVNIDTLHQRENKVIVDIRIRFTERWYLWPVPYAELADRNLNEWLDEKDFSRINYGIYLDHGNFRGRNEKLQIAAKLGFDQNIGLQYFKPNIDYRQTMGVGAGININRKHELPYATIDDKQVFYRENRRYVFKVTEANLMFNYRPGIYSRHSLSLKFSQYDLADTIFILNPDYCRNQQSSQRFLSISYEYRSDHRNLRYYPLQGYYFDLQLVKYGLGFLQNSSLDVLYAKTTLKKYWNLLPHLYFMAGTTVKISSASFQPYLLQQGLGYRYDYVRGYEYYVVDGQHFAMLRTNLKYELLAPRTFRLPFIRNDRFGKLHLSLYLGLHSDVAWVMDDQFHNKFDNQLPNKALWGNGIGFDVVTYYDKVIRFEYSANNWGEHGFYVHFLAPI